MFFAEFTSENNNKKLIKNFVLILQSKKYCLQNEFKQSVFNKNSVNNKKLKENVILSVLIDKKVI